MPNISSKHDQSFRTGDSQWSVEFIVNARKNKTLQNTNKTSIAKETVKTSDKESRTSSIVSQNIVSDS